MNTTWLIDGYNLPPQELFAERAVYPKLKAKAFIANSMPAIPSGWSLPEALPPVSVELSSVVKNCTMGHAVASRASRKESVVNCKTSILSRRK